MICKNSQIEKSGIEEEYNDLIKISKKHETELGDTRIQLIQKQAIINEIEGSLGYRTLNRYRRIIENLFPPNSKRRRLYSLINTGLKTLILNGFGFFVKRFSIFLKKPNRKNNNITQSISSNTNKQIAYFSNNDSNPFLEIYKIYTASSVGKNGDYYVPFEKKLEQKNINFVKLIAFYLHNSILFPRMMNGGERVLLNGPMFRKLYLNLRTTINPICLMSLDFMT